MNTIKQHYINNSVESIQLPVPPGEFTIKSGKNTTSIKLLGFGEINDSGTPTLKAWTISSFFPAQDYTFVQGTRKSNPYDYCDLIDKLKNNNVVCTYVISETNINISCTIEEFEYGEKDGSGDVYFTISFKEHKEINLSTNQQSQTYYTGTDQMATAYTVANLAQPYSVSNLAQAYTTSYTVKDGDTLITIAKAVYADSSKYTQLISKNNLKNVNDIKVGQVLKT